MTAKSNRLPHNCRPGSAWHTWQVAGADWRAENPAADHAKADRAARQYAADSHYPEIGQAARHRAFLEGCGKATE